MANSSHQMDHQSATVRREFPSVSVVLGLGYEQIALLLVAVLLRTRYLKLLLKVAKEVAEHSMGAVHETVFPMNWCMDRHGSCLCLCLTPRLKPSVELTERWWPWNTSCTACL